MDIRNFDHVNLSVRDFEATADWYGRVFRFRLVEEGLQDGVRWGILRSRGGEGEEMLCIYEYPDREFLDRLALRKRRIHGVNHLGFRIQDEAEWEATRRREGVPATKWEWPHSKAWYVTDPTGYEIEVALWKEGVVSFAHASGH